MEGWGYQGKEKTKIEERDRNERQSQCVRETEEKKGGNK